MSKHSPSAGVFLVVLGIWTITQVWWGDALGRLGIS